MITEKQRAYNKAYDIANRERKIAYRASHKSELAAAHRAYVAKHREEIRAYGRARRAASRDRDRQRQYGISPQEFSDMLLQQGGRCAACGSIEWGTRGPCVDHDHQSGIVRGILCHKCNTALGLMGDSPDRARSLAEYLEIPRSAR